MVNMYCTKGKSGGDYVIMMTDGVADCFMENGDDLSAYLKNPCNNFIPVFYQSIIFNKFFNL